MILGLQELKFLLNPIQRFRDREFERLACSLVRRLEAPTRGTEERGREQMETSESRQGWHEIRVGHKTKLEVV